jgi:hypothetical protein
MIDQERQDDLGEALAAAAEYEARTLTAFITAKEMEQVAREDGDGTQAGLDAVRIAKMHSDIAFQRMLVANQELDAAQAAWDDFHGNG